MSSKSKNISNRVSLGEKPIGGRWNRSSSPKIFPCEPWKLLDQGIFMARKRRFQGRRIDSTCLRWAFCPAKHGWKYFLTLNSFPAQIRKFKNLKGTWHQMHARSGQLQGIFGFLKPLIHVWILVWSWSVDKNDPVPAVRPTTRNRMHQLKRCNLGYFLVLGCRHAAISVRPT